MVRLYQNEQIHWRWIWIALDDKYWPNEFLSVDKKVRYVKVFSRFDFQWHTYIMLFV